VTESQMPGQINTEIEIDAPASQVWAEASLQGS
jgi:hypothetical protein